MTPIFFNCFMLYSESSRNYKTVAEFTDQFLGIIFTSSHSEYVKFDRYNPKVSHCRHACNIQDMINI